MTSVDSYPKMYLYRRVVQAKLFIDTHFSEDIDLTNIADEAYFSKFHFIRLFKSCYGKTPHHYLTQVRIEAAKKLLIKGQSISEVCDMVGFDSSTSFASLFKRQVGVPPSAFQRLEQIRHLKMASSPLHFIPNCFAEFSGWTKNRNIQ